MDLLSCRASRSHQQGALSLRSVLLLFTGSLMLLVILANATVSFDRFRDYVSDQLQVHAKDGATAIGLSLSNAIDGRDPVAAASLLDAVFDSGRYLSVSYLDPLGNPVAVRETTLAELSVPDWFVNLIQLPLPLGEAEVVRGWAQLGRVTVVSHPGTAYEDLWGAALSIVSGSLVIGVLGLACLFWLTGRALRPLQWLEVQAKALGNRDFRKRVQARSTRELNQVTRALNQMADDLERQFEGQARLIEQLRKLNNEDALTGLASRSAFDQRLTAGAESEERAETGVLILIQLAGFADYNLRLGHNEADALLVRVADTLQQFVEGHAGTFAGRRSGAQFSLFMAGASRADGGVWGEQMISELGRCFGSDQPPQTLVVHAGVAALAAGQSIRDLWAAADEALRQAQAGGVSGCHLADQDRLDHRNSAQWQTLMTEAVAAGRLSLWAQPMVDPVSGDTLFHQLSSRLDIGEDPLKASIFIPMAERFGLIADIDRQVVSRALALLRSAPEKRLGVTLGEGSLADPDFCVQLIEQLQSAGSERQSLLLGISEQALRQNRRRVAGVVDSLGNLSVPVIVDRFGVGGVPFNYLNNLSISAVRIDHSFVHNIDRHDDNRFFLESVVSIALSAGKRVFAPGVESAAEYETLAAIGVDAMMGYHLGRPAELPPEAGDGA